MSMGEEPKVDPLPGRKAAWNTYNTKVSSLRAEYAEKQAALRVTMDEAITAAHTVYDAAILELRTWFDDEMESARRAHALSV